MKRSYRLKKAKMLIYVLVHRSSSSDSDDSKSSKLKVTMVTWSQDDTYVITTVTDYTVKVWYTDTGKLAHILRVRYIHVDVMHLSCI